MEIKSISENTEQIIQKKLYDQPFPELEKRLDYRADRHSLISANMANINTPNYRAFDLIMDERQKEPILTLTSTPVKDDGNSVDLDFEMSKLTENQLMFTMLTTTISKRFEQLRSVIAEGRK